MQAEGIRADQRRGSRVTVRGATGVFWVAMAILFLSCNSALMHEGALKYASTDKLAIILGAVAISTPWILAVLPFQAGMSLTRPLAFGLRLPTMGTLVVIAAYAVFIAYNVLNGSNALTTSRVEVVAHKQQDFDRLQAMRDQRAALMRQQQALPTYRPVATVTSLIEAEKTSKRWQKSGECKDATSAKTRDYCAQVRTMEAELGAAQRGEQLQTEIVAIDNRLEASGPATGEVDPQAAAIAKMTGLTEQDVRAGVGMFGPLALEFGALVFLTFAGRALGWDHMHAPAARQGSAEPVFNPAPLMSPEAIRATPVTSLEALSAQRKLAEWFFKTCTRPVASGAMPECEWYEHYCAICKKSNDIPLPIESFRRVASRFIPRMYPVGGEWQYFEQLPLIPENAA